MYRDLFASDFVPDVVTSRAEPNATDQALDRFLAGVERRALVTAELATRDRDEALDIVQDTMLAFARRYANRPDEQWPPLFHRILQNRIRDWHRRGSVRKRLFGWLTRTPDDGGDRHADPLQNAADPRTHAPDALAAQQVAGDAMIDAIADLPTRQREAFVLRVWEGLGVDDTATAMGCSAGSVKTHLSRALAALRVRLQDHYR